MRVLITAEEIRTCVRALGGRLSEEYRDRPLTVIGVLNGSVVLLADLMREITIPHRVAFVQASSYRGAVTTAGALSVDVSGLPDLRDRDVLLLDDIFDTGRTLATLVDGLKQHQPRSLRTAVLLWKLGRQQVTLQPDEFCFQIPDEFVVGYGLDFNDDYRHLPYVAVLEPSDL